MTEQPLVKDETSEKLLADFMLEAIEHNYLISIIITSYTSCVLESKQFPWGVGKTTLMFWLNYYLNGQSWDRVFETTAYNPYEFFKLVDPNVREKQGRLNCICFDDMQATAPAESGVPSSLRRMGSYLTTNRPEVACIIATADNINNVVSPLRKLFIFEIIVPQRGMFEVHQHTHRKDFKHPMLDTSRLRYIQHGLFPPMPKDIQMRYDLWRVNEKKKIYGNVLLELEMFSRLKQWNLDAIDKGEVVNIEGTVSKVGGDQYVLRLPHDVGERLYREEVQAAVIKKNLV
jgi:hypothetical protein